MSENSSIAFCEKNVSPHKDSRVHFGITDDFCTLCSDEVAQGLLLSILVTSAQELTSDT
jgi:hypothetical protein